jgi:hypothetical protein
VDSVEKARDKPRQPQTDCHSCDSPAGDERRHTHEHESHDPTGDGAQGHANTDFGASTGDRVRGDAVQPETGKQQSKRSEAPCQKGNQPFLVSRRVDVIAERPERERQSRIDPADRRRDISRRDGRIAP